MAGPNALPAAYIWNSLDTAASVQHGRLHQTDRSEIRALWTSMPRNLLKNGAMQVHQRAPLNTNVTGVANTYQVNDCWKTVWNSGAAGAVAPLYQVSGNYYMNPGSGPQSALLITQGGPTKCGWLQLLESGDVIGLRGKQVSLQAKWFVAATVGDVRMAVIAWLGTADAPTAPIASGSAWNGAAALPTLNTSWVYAKTPVAITPTPGVWTQTVDEAISVPTSTMNLAVLVWCNDVVVDGNSIVAVTDVQLNEGPVASLFDRAPRSVDELRCQTWLHKGTRGPAQAASTEIAVIEVPLVVQMRAAPTSVSYYDANGISLTDSVSNYGQSAPSASIDAASPTRALVRLSNYTGLPVSPHLPLITNANNAGELLLSAEL